MASQKKNSLKISLFHCRTLRPTKSEATTTAKPNANIRPMTSRPFVDVQPVWCAVAVQQHYFVYLTVRMCANPTKSTHYLMLTLHHHQHKGKFFGKSCLHSIRCCIVDVVFVAHTQHVVHCIFLKPASNSNSLTQNKNVAIKSTSKMLCTERRTRLVLLPNKYTNTHYLFIYISHGLQARCQCECTFT